MYRIHNIGIESKIDYLVEHGIFQGKKLVIVLWNEHSMRAKTYLNMKWGGEVSYIIDDEISKYNSIVRPMEFIKELLIQCSDKEEYIYLLAGSNGQVIKASNELDKYGIPESSRFYLRGKPIHAQDAMLKCCEDVAIHTVLDVGCGDGRNANIFSQYGKQVTGIDLGIDVAKISAFRAINGNFETYVFKTKFDLVWSSHVLEHQQQIRSFIQKLFSLCDDNGKVAITVPDCQSSPQSFGYVVQNHVTFWNIGVLIYNIILSGYSCVHASAKRYAGQVSVIVPNEKYEFNGDYRQINDYARNYFPQGMDVGKEHEYGGIYFNGNINEINWDN